MGTFLRTDIDALLAEAAANPPRPTLLYSLPPLGVGTHQVESLSSYFTRLSAEHSLAPGVMLSHVLGPHFGDLEGRRGRFMTQAQASFRGAFNSTGLFAGKLADALGWATGQADLRRLSMTPCAEVISPLLLLRDRAAWCPACMREDLVPYERLLWAVRAVEVCPVHGKRLACACPHCGQPNPIFSWRARAGFCRHCFRAFDEGDDPPADNHAPSGLDAAVAWQVGGLLAAFPAGKGGVEADRLPWLLTRMQELWGVGGGALAKAFNIPERNIRSWCMSGTQPCLPQLLQIGVLLDIPVAELLWSDRDKLTKALSNKRPSGSLDLARRPNVRWAAALTEEERACLRTILTTVVEVEVDPAPTVKALARQMKRSPDALRRHFPDLCRDISSRHRAQASARALARRMATRQEILGVIEAIRAEGAPLTYTQVQKRVPKARLLMDPFHLGWLKRLLAEEESQSP